MAVVDFTPAAKAFSVGGDINKRIYLTQNMYDIGISYPYSEAMIMDLKKMKIPIKDLTSGLAIPQESNFIPSSKIISGRLELRKAIG